MEEKTTTLKMKYSKSTKSTDVYQSEDNEPQPISTLYVYKWFSQQCPTVTVQLKNS